MIEVIEFNKTLYPKFQSNGNAARFCRPFASEVCKGEGFDIGYGKEEWKFPGAIGVDLAIDPTYNANYLPPLTVDYIHSSHCLEHIPNWSESLLYWASKIRSGGTLFLYLPDFSQKYWRTWSNKKHIHNLEPHLISEFLIECGLFKNIFVSGVDNYNSFIAMAEKI
jgi:Methyltransferase domain